MRKSDAGAQSAPTFMVIPSLACQAACKYCFGPHEGAVMDERTAAEAIRFIGDIARETGTRELRLVFHGGEPLLAPMHVWEAFFHEIEARLAGYEVSLSLQSNLWNLTEEHLDLFCRHDVAIGTSLDGPRALCDLNRGEGYHERTAAAIKRAERRGRTVSAIATVTKQTLPHVGDIARHFGQRGMPLALHGALAPLGEKASPYALSVGEYAQMVKGLFPWYVENRKHMRIDTLDHYARGIVFGEPGVCTFCDCLGMFLAIGPNGDITSCQRLAGKDEFAMGNIFERPTLAALYGSDAARAQEERERMVHTRCGDCVRYPICKGGCYYNALASGDGVVDPLCKAYGEIYAYVQEEILREMASPENREAVAARPPGRGEHPLLREGPCISLAGEIHPAEVADNARNILALYELARAGEPRPAAQSLCDQRICGDMEGTEALLTGIRAGLYANHKKRNNCYIHVTLGCNLRCSHCYANAGDGDEEMSPVRFESLVGEAIAQGFRQVVVTGGEPLIHTGRDALLKCCADHRGRGTNLVLRTNLTGDFGREELLAIAGAFDQVVVSVDGNEGTHDARRGAGAYGNVTGNLEAYAALTAGLSGAGELSLACVMGAEDIDGEPGESVRALGDRLRIRRLRFKPLLPIGRAAHMEEPVICEGIALHERPEELLKSPAKPLTTCGIGQNLYVRPDGGAHPCYAWCGAHTHLGNVFEAGLGGLLESPGFVRLTECSVDTVDKCRACPYRYLCGGACRAWGNQSVHDLNAAPADCGHLQAWAGRLVRAARAYIG